MTKAIPNFTAIADPQLTGLANLCAMSLYYELGGLGPDPASSSSSSSSSAVAGAAKNQPLLPHGNQSANAYRTVPSSRPSFPVQLKRDLIAEQRQMFAAVAANTGIANPADGVALQHFMKAMDKLMCPGCLEHREPELMERDHLDAWAFVKQRLDTFLDFLNEPGNEAFADKLIAHSGLNGVFVKEKGEFKITGSGLARAYSAHFNMWLLCRLCNGGSGKSAEDIKSWFDNNDFFKGFTDSLGLHGLSIERGLLLKGLFGASTNPLLLLGGDSIPLRASAPVSLRVKALEWVCSQKKLLIQALQSIHGFSSRLSGDARAASKIKNTEKRKRAQEAQQKLVGTMGEVYTAATKSGSFAQEVTAANLGRKHSTAKKKAIVYNGAFKVIENALSTEDKDDLIAILGPGRIDRLSKESWSRLARDIETCVEESEGAGEDKVTLKSRLQDLLEGFVAKMDEKAEDLGSDDSVSVSSDSASSSDGDNDQHVSSFMTPQ